MDCTIRLVCALFAVTLVHSRSTRRRPVPVPEGWRDQLHESVLTLPSFIESLNGDTGSTSSESTEARNPLSAADAPRPDFTEDLKDPQVTGILPPSYLWPKSGRETIIHYTVPHRIERSQVANITAALETIQEQTGSCVQFQQVDEVGIKRNALREYIVFKLAKDKNCYTHIGRRNGANPIWLSRSCLSETGIIMHEVLHKLGLFHEHSRPDRSDFVSVHYQNIFPNVSNQFEEYHNMDTHNLPYDVESIMHYGPLNGAKNAMNPSLTLRSYFDGDKIKMGQREELSETDVKRVLLLYNCSTLDHLEEALDAIAIQRSSAHYASEPDPFSVEEMSEAQWNLHNASKYCQFPVLASDVYAASKTRTLAISCEANVTKSQLTNLVSLFHKRPIRPIGIFLHDDLVNIKFRVFQKISAHVVIFLLRYCIARDRTKVLRDLQFQRLVRFHLVNCHNIIIRRQDFSGRNFNNLRMVTFSNTTIGQMEPYTFTDLPALLTISLAYAANWSLAVDGYQHYLERLHCTQDFCWFRKWMNRNTTLFHSRPRLGEIYNLRNSWISKPVSSRLLHLQYDCRPSRYRAIIPSRNDEDHPLFSLNDQLSC